MAVIHRALFTWFTVLVFLILLVLRLDHKVEWNWFLIFIPLWLFDAVVVIYITVNMIVHCKNGYDRNELTMRRKAWFMASVVLKMSFQVLLCLKVQYFDDIISTYIVMIPFWLVLSGASFDVFRSLMRLHWSPVYWKYFGMVTNTLTYEATIRLLEIRCSKKSFHLMTLKPACLVQCTAQHLCDDIHQVLDTVCTYPCWSRYALEKYVHQADAQWK